MIPKLLAQGIKNPAITTIIGGFNAGPDTGGKNTGRFISALVGAFLTIAVVATLIYFLLGGLEWITAEGDKAKLESARNKITHALLGLIIVASAWAIWMLAGSFLGINFNELPFPTLGK